MSLIIRAAQFADAAHTGQKRKTNGLPYITHVIKVAGRVATLSEATEEMVAAAYLHDVIEDCGIVLPVIKQLFGETVAGYTIALTNRSKQIEIDAKISCEGYNKPIREERKRIDREYLIYAPIEVKRIKMVDRLDNLTDTLQKADPGWALMYVAETELLHRAALIEADKDLDRELFRLCNKIKEKYKK